MFSVLSTEILRTIIINYNPCTSSWQSDDTKYTYCYIQVLADGASAATLGAAQLAIQTSLVLTNGTILTLGDIEDKVRLMS